MNRLHANVRRIPTLLLGALLVGCAGEPPEIDRLEVERIVSTLASDDMQGRATFTAGIERAQAFLEEEFAAVGLEPLTGADAFAQPFDVYTIANETATLSLNGSALADDRFAIRIASGSISWDETTDVNVVHVTAEDDLRGVYTEAFSAGVDALLLVDPIHAELFSQIRGGISRPRRTMSATEGSIVVALTDGSEVSSYQVEATGSIESMGTANVVGQIPGRRSDEFVLFSAHYDHIGMRPGAGGDSIANGANDNASGTAAVVMLAKYFEAMGTPERTLLFVAFTGEESGGWGSRYFSEQLDPDQIVAMFNIEMIGKPAVSGPNTAWITGYDRSDFGTILGDAVEGTDYSFYADPYPDQNLFYRSDNATLARLGVPAHTISTTPIDVDQDYHRVTDEISTLNLDHLTNTVRAIALGAQSIVSGERTPTRVDPATVN